MALSGVFPVWVCCPPVPGHLAENAADHLRDECRVGGDCGDGLSSRSGVGSLGGGAVSKIPGCSPLFLFCLAELSIGCFGLASLSLFHWIGRFTLRLSGLGTSLTALLLVLFPTVFMGGTLPLLTAHAVKGNGNVGRSVAALYFVNTLG